jgi:hypothetical protein
MVAVVIEAEADEQGSFLPDGVSSFFCVQPDLIPALRGRRKRFLIQPHDIPTDYPQSTKF